MAEASTQRRASWSAKEMNSEHRLRMENLHCDIDVWYPQLQQFTFPSHFLPLQREEARAIIAYHNLTWRHAADGISAEHIQTLRRLEARIEQTLLPLEEKGAFMRLCGRSPKDGEPLNRQAVYEAYQRELQALLDSGEPLNAATKIIAIGRVNWMKINTAADAMSLLLTSERVYSDMIDWLQYGEPEQLVFREWDDDVTLENEFRVFVRRGQITAISQYDHYAVYPSLADQVDQIRDGIIELWQEIHPVVGEDSYVMDFAYLPSQDKFIMVELSPFLPCTGAACFNWSADREVLENGPLEFRLNKRLPDYLDDIIDINWETRWQETTLDYRKVLEAWADYHENQKGLLDKVAELVDSLVCAPDASRKTTSRFLFVYGTLKRGFHWHKKFLSDAWFLSEAVTCESRALVVGESGVPYMLQDVEGGHQVKGEVFLVDDEILAGLDDYEGVAKGYYARVPIEVDCATGVRMTADVYVKVEAGEDLCAGPFFDEYTLEYHNEHYRPMRHIQVKQQAYLGKPSTWGKTETASFDARLT